MIREQFWDITFLPFFLWRQDAHVQDLPLLAAPCRWDHHLCTDLKQEGKVMENAVRRAVRRTRSYKYVIWLYVSYCILVWTVRNIHSPWRSAGRLADLKFQVCKWTNVITTVNYLSIRNRKRRRRQREIEVAIKLYKAIFFHFLSSLFSDFEADGACWRTTRTGF